MSEEARKEAPEKEEPLTKESVKPKDTSTHDIPESKMLSAVDHSENVDKFLLEKGLAGEGERKYQVVRNTRSIWEWEDTGIYRELYEIEEDKLANDYLKDKYCLNAKNEAVKFCPNEKKRREFVKALKCQFQVTNEIEKGSSWLFGAAEKMPNPALIIPFRNCLFDVEKFIKTRDPHACVMKHTPRFFNAWRLPYDLDPNDYMRKRPTLLLNTLSETFEEDWAGGEHESLDLFFEYAGYGMTDLTHFQKMLLLIGKTGQGKGLMLRLLQKLVGPTNYVTPMIANLHDKNGMYEWLHKRLAIFGDCYIPEKFRTEIETVLLKVVGEDDFSIPVKYQNESIQTKLKTKIVMASNDMPNVKNSGRAFSRRFLALNFPERDLIPDITLEGRIEKEIPLIAWESLDGLCRLWERGSFKQPEKSQFLLDQAFNNQSTMGRFVEECCILGSGLQIERSAFKQAYEDWCRESDERPEVGTVKKKLMDFCGRKVGVGRFGHGDKSYTYTGITLNYLMKQV